jgi:hypothetical protein
MNLGNFREGQSPTRLETNFMNGFEVYCRPCLHQLLIALLPDNHPE